DAVKFAFHSAEENGVGRDGADEAGEVGHGGEDEVEFFAAEVAVFAGVGIEPGDGDARGAAEAQVQEFFEQTPHADDLGTGQQGRDSAQRDVRGDERDGEPAAGEAHGEIFHAPAVGEKF